MSEPRSLEGEIVQLLDASLPEIVFDFAEALHKEFRRRVDTVNGRAREAYRGQFEQQLREVMARKGLDVEQASPITSDALTWYRNDLEAEKKELLAQQLAWMRGAVGNLISWWEDTGWNPENRRSA